MFKRHPVWTTVGLLLVFVIVAAVILLSAIDEPLRRYAEREANESLPGYHVEIGDLEVHPLTLSVDLHDVVVRQEAFGEPPLATIPHLIADARLAPLFTGTLAADLHLEGPVFAATRQQIDKALQGMDKEEVKEEAVAWQDRLRDTMAFEGAVYLTNGQATFTGEPAAQPVRLQDLQVTARRLTNRPAEGETYPSDLSLSVRFLDQARVEMNGRADVLAKPHPALQAETSLRAVDVAKALSLVGQTDVPIKSGTVEMTGRVEYGPERKAVTIEQVTVAKPNIVYVNDPTANKLAAQTEEAAAEAMAWQDRVLNLFPVTVREAAIREGTVTYRHTPRADPLSVSNLAVTARNLRNVKSKPGDHPSELRVSARLSEKARLDVDGKADFFAKPTPAVQADVRLEDLPIARLMPVTSEYNLQLRDGLFDMAAQVKHGREKTVVSVDSFLLERAKIDYVHKAETKGQDARRAKQGAKQAAKAHRDPSLVLTVDHGKILDSEVGFVNRSASPDYRVFITDMNVDMDNFSNRLEEGTGVVKVTGKFMGSGPTVVTGTFRPEKPRPDFDLAVKIIKTDVTALNDVMRAHGNLDTHGGVFSFFSELSVKNNRIDGYVKPLMRDVDVYDPKKDQDKAASEKIYEAVVGGAMSLLENTPRDTVATKAEVSGELDQPDVSTWQIIGSLMENAFFNAILPGFAGNA